MIEDFCRLADGKVRYPLPSVLVIAVCTAIAGAESYEDIVLCTVWEEQIGLAQRVSRLKLRDSLA